MIDSLEERIWEYVKRHWYDEETLDDLRIFLDEGYLQLAVYRLVGAGAIDPELSLCPKTETLCLKYIEDYTSANAEADTEECLNNVNPEILIHPRTNEVKFIPPDVSYVTEDYLKDDYVSEGKWKNMGVSNG